MGNIFARALKPEVTPGPNEEPSFDPMFGFEHGRKKRGKCFSFNIMSPSEQNNNFLDDFLVMIATPEEMESAKLPIENRDYCAHLALKLLQCRREVWPWAYKCAPEKHEYLDCQFEE